VNPNGSRSLFVDVGSNFGWFSIVAASRGAGALQGHIVGCDSEIARSAGGESGNARSALFGKTEMKNENKGDFQ
jgi:hypothetical protein